MACAFLGSLGWSCGGQALAGEVAENLFPADSVPGQIGAGAVSALGRPSRPVPRPQVAGGIRLRPRARGLKREAIAHLGTLDFVIAKDNVVFLGPPGTGETHYPPGWASGPARPGTGSCSPPPRSGSPGSPTPTPAASEASWPGWAATP